MKFGIFVDGYRMTLCLLCMNDDCYQETLHVFVVVSTKNNFDNRSEMKSW